MTRKTWLTILLAGMLALIIALSGVLSACSPAAPTGDMVPKADLDQAQADLTAEKAKSAAAEKKAKDLEAELAAIQKPVEVYHWQPSTWASSGTPWDSLVYIANYINEESDGRFDVVPSAPGAIAPVEEMIEAVGSGLVPATQECTPYYSGKIPMAYAYGSPPILGALDLLAVTEYYKDGALLKAWYSSVEGLYNVKCAGDSYMPGEDILTCAVPIRGIEDLQGKKFRSGNEIYATPLTFFGGSVVWFPGAEIYTSMATNVVDAFTYGNAYVHYEMGYADVAKYWIRTPTMCEAQSLTFVVNGDIWNGMPKDLQKIVEVAIDASTLRVTVEAEQAISTAWKQAEAAGVEIIDWSPEDVMAFQAKQLELAKTWNADANHQMTIDYFMQYAEEHGYL